MIIFFRFRCEIYRVLLLLLIQPTPQNVSPSLTSVLEKYAWETSCPIVSNSDQSSQGNSGGGSGGAFGANPSPGGIIGNQYLSEDVFLLLQSVVMAVQVKTIIFSDNVNSELRIHVIGTRPDITQTPFWTSFLIIATFYIFFSIFFLYKTVSKKSRYISGT